MTTPLRLAVVVGNPRPGSRTLQVATALAERLRPQGATLRVVELAEYADRLFHQDDADLAALAAEVASSDLIVFATPTYKAAYTGMLKAFLDRYSTDGLAGTIAIPVHTGADLQHSLAPTVSLAPVLAELGAVVPGRGFYFVTGDMNALDAAVEAAAETYLDRIRRVGAFAAARG
jgi:FMN reductase